MNAVAYAQKTDSTVKEAARLLRAAPDNVLSRMEETMDALKERERELKKLGDRIASAQSEELLDNIIEVKGVKLLAVTLENADTDALRKFVDTARDRMKSGVVVAGSVNDGKVMFACGVTKDTMDRVKAGDVVREVAKIAEGSGGGRPDMAMAGGKNPAKLGEAIAAVPAVVEKLIG
jgi:alanyl-tRNA synthetase